MPLPLPCRRLNLEVCRNAVEPPSGRGGLQDRKDSQVQHTADGSLASRTAGDYVSMSVKLSFIPAPLFGIPLPYDTVISADSWPIGLGLALHNQAALRPLGLAVLRLLSRTEQAFI